MECWAGTLGIDAPPLLPVSHQDMKQHIVLVMELCEYDLDYLVKASPFREDDITLFLFQLGEYMKGREGGRERGGGREEEKEED